MSELDPSLLDGAIPPAENTRLFGHDAAQAFLAGAYRSGKGHHAILIEGPEGIGKATLAYRFAAHVLTNPDPASAPDAIADPDPDSSVARQIASGASHNLLHLSRPRDEKSGRLKSAITVDEIRRLSKFFGQTSGTGNWRIAIIDPADDMNRNAANAVLKMLEEPPKRAMFLVLSHAPGKLLPTIRSRCQTLTLSALSDVDMEQALGHLGVTMAATQRATVLAAAKGSVATALKLLNYGGADIVAALEETLGASGPSARKKMHKLADVLSGKDAETIYEFFIDHVTDDLVDRARAAALSGKLSEANRLARLSSEINERVTVAQAYNLDRKQTIISLLESIA